MCGLGGCSVGFGQRVKGYRVKNNYTQEQFGKMLYVTPTMVSKIESGKMEPSSNILYYIAKNTNCDIDWLLLGIKSDRINMSEAVSRLSIPSAPEEHIVRYVIEMIKIKLIEQDMMMSADRYKEYTFNLQLAEIVCVKYANKADEGQVFKSIRRILGKSMKEMSDILDIKSTRYSYLEKNGRPTLNELIKLYETLRVNPGFVLRGQCQELMVINELLKMINNGGIR